LKALKEQQEKQVEQEDDEMMYTYARDNERKVKYNYTYSSARNSLVASELARHEKSSATSHSSFSFPIPLSPVSLAISSSPLSPRPPLSPPIINTQRRRLQIVSSPPPPLSPIIIRKQPPSPIIQNRQNDILDNSSKRETNVHRHLLQIPSATNPGAQQKILILNSSQSVNELSVVNSTNNFRPIIISNRNPVSICKSSTSRPSSSTTETLYRIQSLSQTNEQNIICQIQTDRILPSTKKTK
jgi:hypothetical protein